MLVEKRKVSCGTESHWKVWGFFKRETVFWNLEFPANRVGRLELLGSRRGTSTHLFKLTLLENIAEGACQPTVCSLWKWLLYGGRLAYGAKERGSVVAVTLGKQLGVNYWSRTWAWDLHLKGLGSLVLCRIMLCSLNTAAFWGTVGGCWTRFKACLGR